MKPLFVLTLFLLLALTFIQINNVAAQCAVCTTNVSSNVKSGGTQAAGLNAGILFLLAAPYLAITVGGYVWYKKYRRNHISMSLKNEKIHLN